jgi:hypothetical protein
MDIAGMVPLMAIDRHIGLERTATAAVMGTGIVAAMAMAMDTGAPTAADTGVAMVMAIAEGTPMATAAVATAVLMVIMAVSADPFAVGSQGELTAVFTGVAAVGAESI